MHLDYLNGLGVGIMQVFFGVESTYSGFCCCPSTDDHPGSLIRGVDLIDPDGCFGMLLPESPKQSVAHTCCASGGS